MMLIVLRLIAFYYFVTTSLGNIEKASENSDKLFYSSAPKSYKTDYSAGNVGSYSKGGLYAPSAVTTHQRHETAATEACNTDELICLSMSAQDRLAIDAIKALHRQLDDDADGIVDLSESDEFLREDLKYQDGYQRRQQAFHRNDDKHISVKELWDAWLRSEVHNWTVEQTVEWLTTSVELPQYASTFMENRVNGATLPRLAVGNFQFLSTVLGIKDPIHKQKIALKAMDVVLFGPPKGVPRLARFRYSALDCFKVSFSSRYEWPYLTLAALENMQVYLSSAYVIGFSCPGVLLLYVLFVPPSLLKLLSTTLDYYHPTKDIILVTLLLGALVGCWWAYRQNKLSRRHLRRMIKDMESLQRAELALEDLQRELEHAKKEQENVATEKLDLERRLLEQAGDGEKMKVSYSNLEVAQLKQELEMLRSELQRAEGELQDRCWSPPVGLQHWLQMTHEIENKSYMKKRLAAEKQLQQAREACEKLRKKRSSLVGAFVSTHGKSIDEVDRSIVEARTSLNEVTAELQERVHRWKQIELLCGFNIINNNGLSYLESVLYRNTPNGRGLKGLGKINSSQDDLDEDSGSIYSPSAGCFENWKEDSSGSEQGKNEIDDDGQQETKSMNSNIHFTLGGDTWGDDISPMPILPKKGQKNSMIRSHSQDNNVNTSMLEREKEKEYLVTGQTKFSQSESNLDGPGIASRYSHIKKLSRDPSLDFDEIRTVRKVEEHLRKSSDDRAIRRIGKDQPEEDPKLVFIKNFKDKEISEEEKNLGHRQSRDMPDDFRKPVVRDAQFDTSNFRRTAADELRKQAPKEVPNDLKKTGGGEDRRVSVEDCRKIIENSRKGRLEDFKKSNNSTSDDKEETHSTDSNSTATDDPETKKKKLKLFSTFRKNKSKLS